MSVRESRRANPATGGRPARTPSGTLPARRSARPPAREPARQPVPSLPRPRGASSAASRAHSAAAAPAYRAARPPRHGQRLRLGDPGRRLRAALLGFAVLLSLFAGRLVQLQGVEAPGYASDAQNARTRSETLDARRGSVTDARGVVLATSVEAYDVVADQTLVVDATAAAARLAPLLGLDPALVQSRLTGARRHSVVARRVAPETWRQVNELRLPGVLGQETTRRVYPARTLAANVVGFVGEEGNGLSGLELTLDERLRGRDGRSTYEAGAGGRRIPLGEHSSTAAVPGADVRLSIDRDIQWAAQRALARALQRSQAANGTVVVLDARSGDVLALAAEPTFDANDPGAAPAETRGNRALTEVYEPGSTGKAITAAAAIEDGLVTPETTFVVPNRLERGGTTFADSEDHEALQLSFTEVMARSSNIGTILASEALPPERLHDWFTRFGIGTPTGVDLPGESRGILAPPGSWSASQRYTIAFGQGYSVNALQMASAFATLASDGVRVTPRVVKGWTDPERGFVPAPAPAPARVVSPETARQVRSMLEAVVREGGTGTAAAIPGYAVGGKTGTANRVDPRTGQYAGYTASFVGFARTGDFAASAAPAGPAGSAGPDVPSLVVAVTLQDPKTDYHGGTLAAPVFKEVMSFALQALRIPPAAAPSTGGAAADGAADRTPDGAGGPAAPTRVRTP